MPRNAARILSALLGLTAVAPATAAVSPAEAREIARDAYVYGTPMVDQYWTMFAFSIDKTNAQYKGPFNTVLNVARLFTPDDTAFVTPNSDTPYTFAGLDLRAEPVVITVPRLAKGRYFVFQLIDLYTFNFAYIGTRATGNGGGHFLVVGPRWKGKVPAGITRVLHAETELVSVVGRTQLFGPDDLEAVKQIQDGYKVQPLSAFLGEPAPPAAPEVQWLKALSPVEARNAPEFFTELAFLLQFAQPPHPSEVALRQRFATLGIVPGQPFDVAALSPDLLAAAKEGMLDGQKQIDARRTATAGKTDTLFGTRQFLRNDFVARAAGAQVGIGANSREEAMYPFYEKDGAGQPLDGSHRYTLRFARGALPPVNAFWSLTVYTVPQQLLVKNPMDRYLINTAMLPVLKRDPDGGITLYVQADSPGKDRESNWLPAPSGPFMLAMRCYLPKPALLDGSWKPPPLKRAD